MVKIFYRVVIRVLERRLRPRPNYFKKLLMYINIILDFIMENNVSWVLIEIFIKQELLSLYRIHVPTYLPYKDSTIFELISKGRRGKSLSKRIFQKR